MTQPPNDIAQTATLLLIPFIMAASPLVGWLIGRFLDRQFHTAPYLTYTFLVLGFFAAFREVYRIVKRFSSGD